MCERVSSVPFSRTWPLGDMISTCSTVTVSDSDTVMEQVMVQFSPADEEPPTDVRIPTSGTESQGGRKTHNVCSVQNNHSYSKEFKTH